MLGSGGGSFRKIFEMTARGAKALKKGGTGNTKPSLKDFVMKGKASAVKKPFQVAIQHIETTKKKNKKKTEDLKISGATSKKTKKKSNKVISSSGPGDLVI